MRIARRLPTGILLSAAVAACADGVAPDTTSLPLLFSLHAPAAVSPVETGALSIAFDLVDNYVATVTDSLTGSVLATDTVRVTPGGGSHAIDLGVPSSTVGRSVLITVAGRVGSQEAYRASAYTRVQDGATATPVALNVRYTGPGVRGRLLDTNGEPLAGIVMFLMQEQSQVQATTTAEDGTYLFLGLTPGSYQVEPLAAAGVFVCPGARGVNVTDALASFVADFQVSTEPCPIDLLIVSGGDLAFASDTAVVSALFAQAPNVRRSTFFFVNGPPSLAQLAQYDVVLLFANGLFAQSPVLGDRIEQYVRLGGNLVVATFYWQNRSDSSLRATGWGKLEAIDPFTSGTGQTYQEGSLDPQATVAHPLTTGVSTLRSTGFRGAVAEKPGTTVVARWDDGSPLIGYRVLPWGSRVVAVGLFPASGNAASGSVLNLWRNAVSWAGAAGGPIP